MIIILCLTVSILLLSISIVSLCKKIKVVRFENEFMQDRLQSKSEMLQKRNTMLHTLENTYVLAKHKCVRLQEKIKLYEERLGIS